MTGLTKVVTSASVVAGVSNPDAVKILLTSDPSSQPYPAQYVMDGYLTCSARIVLTAYPAGECMDSDTSQVTYDLDRIPDWGQSEMVWDSTQALGDAMSLVAECVSGVAEAPDPCPDDNLIMNRPEGPAPLLYKVTNTLTSKVRHAHADT